MYTNVSLEAVQFAKNLIAEINNYALNNHQVFASNVNDALSKWNDTHVNKFVNLFDGMTNDLSQMMYCLNEIINFCDRMEQIILMYNN